MILYIAIFLVSCFFLVSSTKWLIDSLSRVAKYLGWKEFVVAFTASIGAIAPEFFIGIISAINRVPELSFGNILGQNVLLFSFTVGLCALILRNGIKVDSKTVKAGSTFAVMAAILPLILIFDVDLSRQDGLILLIFFFFFIYWLFSKKERFTKIYEETESNQNNKKGVISFLKSVGIIFGGFLIVVLSAQGIVESSKFFSEAMEMSIPLIGILIVAVGVGIPETYFSISLARKGQSWMILGVLMGAVAMSSTLVLGTVALICPITIGMGDKTSFCIARFFLIICGLLFLLFVRSGKRITAKEGIILLSLYISFVIIEILIS